MLKSELCLFHCKPLMLTTCGTVLTMISALIQQSNYTVCIIHLQLISLIISKYDVYMYVIYAFEWFGSQWNCQLVFHSIAIP